MVRSILPPVLADRGLAGALTGLAASCAVPCRVDVDVPGRCAASVEATAYFVVAEALTNIAKHSGAAQRDRHRRGATATGCSCAVDDDGRGGADEDGGSGLAGIRRRVEAYDGTLHPDQPARWADDDGRGACHADRDRRGRRAAARGPRAAAARRGRSTWWPPPTPPTAFLAAVDAHKPDVAIVDVRMPPTHTDEGIVAAVEARRRQPGLAVLVLSAYVEQAFATELLAGGAAGLGYLLKERVGRVEEFLDALHRVAGGGTAIDPEVVAPAAGPQPPGQPPRAGSARASATCSR